MCPPVHGQVALVLGLVVAVLTLEHLGRGPVLPLHVPLEVDLPLEDFLALRTHLVAFHRVCIGVCVL